MNKKIFALSLAIFFGSITSSSAAIMTLNGLAGNAQVFVNDTNVRINSSGTTIHTIAWTNSLAVIRGGTGLKTLTSGQLLFGDTAASMSSSASLFWNKNTNRLGIGNSSPDSVLDVTGSILASGSGDIGLTLRSLNDTSKFTIRTNSSFSGRLDILNQSNILFSIASTGFVSIGTTDSSGSSKLKVAGIVESTTGGFKFPDGTVQTTAATSGAKKFLIDTSETLTTNLSGYWSLNEVGGQRNDSSINSNNLADNNSVGTVSAEIANGASFSSGSSQTLTVADNSTLRDDTFSVALWIKTTVSTNKSILTKYNQLSDVGFSFCLNCTNTSHVGLYVSDGAGNYLSKYSSTEVNDGNWHFVIVTRSGQAVNFYIDGGSAESNDNGSVGTVGTITNNASLIFGYDNIGSHYLNGDVDEAGYWGKVLSAQERADLWNAGRGQTMIK